MAVVLLRPGSQFVLNNKGWGTLLKLAYDFGWRPAGTRPPPHWLPGTEDFESRRPWNAADYFTCRGQIVGLVDAVALADALEASLDDLPNHDPDGLTMAHRVLAPGFPSVWALPAGRELNPFETLGGINKPGLKEFIAFCRGGEFSIW